MKQLNLLLATLTLCGVAQFAVAAVAADGAAAAAPAASASGKVQAEDNHAAIRAQKERGSLMSACRKEAADAGLTGVEMKSALVACMKR
ncbi:MAG: hypothetical protein AB9M60_10250 [Leptothrix sp. (in: b-proteobacteria)]